MFVLLLFQVLCNGPGTCIPLCVAGLLLGILGMKKVLIVYVESICRVQTLSLTGKILYLISDYFFVQWSSLRDRYPKSIFLGRTVWNICSTWDQSIHKCRIRYTVMLQCSWINDLFFNGWVMFLIYHLTAVSVHLVFLCLTPHQLICFRSRSKLDMTWTFSVWICIFTL